MPVSVGNFEELRTELGVIAEFLEDRTGLAELRGSMLWYRTSRYGQWRCAAELPDSIVEKSRARAVRLIESFNDAVRKGKEGPSGKKLPKVIPHATDRDDANTVDVRQDHLIFKVVSAAMRVCSKNDRWAGKKKAGTPREELEKAVLKLIRYENDHMRSPGEPELEHLREDFDLTKAEKPWPPDLD